MRLLLRARLRVAVAHSILLTGPDRRRSWSEAERRAILTEAFAPGAIVAAVARRYEVSSGLLYTWRRNAKRESGAQFLRALVTDDQPIAEKPKPLSEPAIVVDLPRRPGQHQHFGER